jgi:predicted ATPase/serine phosphatase RsbU (regulator of sigma subunit)/tRNA A-37 threonylcarbamoyl transferase component Bud32
MVTILDYQITEQLHESSNSLTYRAVRSGDRQSVIIKLLKQAYPPPERIARFKREYELTRGLNLPGVIEVYRFITYGDRVAIVLEDFGAESLAQLLHKQRFSLGEIFPVAIQIIEILGEIHHRHIIHKDINPSNIVFNPQTGQVKLIDFGISTLLSKENPSLSHPNVLEGTLAYISPEQTGRMNRTTDYRTDFYSFGVTLYQILTGQLPFNNTEPIDLVHSHLAKQPTPPQTLNPEIPETLGNIVLKLMSKNAEDRYQSAWGLKADLETCYAQWQTSGTIQPFPLGSQDISDRLHIPQKLYGREQEVANLLAAFERIITPNEQQALTTELTLVSGYSGIGKTALVQEIYKPITRSHGYFIAGKFDQFQRNIPYASLIQAFRSLIKQLLTESESEIIQWREKLQTALGANGQVISEVIPEIETIIGSQPPVPELTPTEAQNRFNFVFQNFITVFTQPEHPLAIFLDDLQWADSASLKLLQRVMTAPESQYLFVIGAYRDNEVSAAHPLMLTLEEIKKEKANISEISLKPLALADVTQLIADTLHQTPNQVQPLGELIQAKTGGNPFFITEFLKGLYGEGLLIFDAKNGEWQWDIQRIQAQPIADNVVDLMAAKLNKLSPETQTALRLAACIGNEFDLRTLGLVAARSNRETARALNAAMDEGFILPLSENYNLIETDVAGVPERLNIDYKFAHDRIQQAAYSLIPDPEKPSVHWQIGQLLLQNTPVEDREVKIFALVNQLNQGRDRITEPAQAEELAHLNLKAGKKAKASAAYQTAFNYLVLGLNLLTENCWQSQYELTLSLYQEATEAAYLSDEFQRMEDFANQVKIQAHSVLDKVKVYRALVLGYANQQLLPEAIRNGLESLQELGISLPEQPTPADIGQELGVTQTAWEGQQIEALIDLPEMTDPEKQAAMDLLFDVIHPAYDSNPALFTLCALKMVQLSLQYGNTPLSAQGYASYGIVLCGVVFDIDSGYQFAKLALKLLERFEVKKIKSAVFFLVFYFSIHWKEHLKETLAPFLEGYQSGLENGDLLFAAFDAYGYSSYSYWIGKELPFVEREMAKYSEAIARINQNHILSYHNRYWQVVLNWMGQAENPCLLVGEAYNETALLPIMRETSDRYGIGDLHLHKFILSYSFGEYAQALENAAIAEQYLNAMIATPSVAKFYFYHSLTLLALYPETPQPEQPGILEKIAANQEKMHRWVQQAPMNYQHKYELVEAERARISGNVSHARDAYDRAITLAKEHEYLNEEALSYELAARFYLSIQNTHLARYYLQDAHYTYQRWGATAKVQHLENRYPQLLNLQTPKTPGSTTTQGTSSSSTTGSSSGESLDLTTVLKASQAISSEIKLDQLLAQLLNLAIENAGAQKGILILSDNNQLKIAAAKLPDSAVQILESLPLNTGNLVPPGIINYVTRTQENVILADATREGLFTGEPYILQQQPQSVLCVPIINQGKLIGILYLENNLATGAFTPERIELLQIISAQAAISLENAQLYRTLEDRVIERTAQLAAANTEIIALNEILKSDNLRMSAELNVTRQLQQKMLPRTEELQQIPQLEIAGFMEPADEVGGDYYDVLNYDGRVKIGIGDVTGHGLESGMVMVMVQTAVRTLLANNETDYVKFLSTINRTLYDNVERMQSDKNLTLALVDYTDGILRISGQHEEILIVRVNGEIERIDTVDLGFPIGLVMEVNDFITQAQVQLNPGDGAVLYTDGITEAANPANEQYGLERLCEVVSQNWHRSAEEIQQMTIDNVREFIGEQKVFDDITLVVLKQR